MAERLFGLETEYAFAALDSSGQRLDTDLALNAFLEAARRCLPHLPTHRSGGMFLQTGGRLYADTGGHPELTTPEVVNPWDLCRYVLAGDRLLEQVAQHVVHARARGIGQLLLSRCNIGYAPGGCSTWGCHENYAYRGRIDDLAAQMIPHLVSRIIYTGAGGFDSASPGIAFMISPRVAFLRFVTSDDSTHRRGIFHCKDESLASRDYHRLHVLCGESLCSQRAMWLRAAVTTLVLAMIEAGLEPCAQLLLSSPLKTMDRFSRDVTLRAEGRLLLGGSCTALQMQRQILEKLEEHADHPIMPPWAPQARQLLRQTLDRLEQGPAAVARSLDWAIKLALFREMARREGVDWDTLPAWNQVLEKTYRELLMRLREQSDHAVPFQEIFAPGGLLEQKVVRSHKSLLKRKKLDPEQCGAVLKLRATLLEADMRFSELSDRGLFRILQRSRQLDHAVPGVDNIEHAMVNPPARGRAKLRGECVKRFHRHVGQYACDWQLVVHLPDRNLLDLSDPFTEKENWQPMPADPPRRSPIRGGSLQREIENLRRMYDEGRYRQVLAVTPMLVSLLGFARPEARVELARLFCWARSRCGSLDTVGILDQLAESEPMQLWLITDYVSVYRFRGLVPADEITTWLARAEQHLSRVRSPSPARLGALREHRGYYLLCAGRLEEAHSELQAAIGLLERSRESARILCRARATLAEVLRRLGNRPQAHVLLEQARREQTEHGFRGDLAEFTFAGLARLAEEPAQALGYLSLALEIQRRLEHPMGEARTLLLRSRVVADAEQASADYQRLGELREAWPALQVCPLARLIWEHWHEWVSGAPCPANREDSFWGV